MRSLAIAVVFLLVGTAHGDEFDIVFSHYKSNTDKIEAEKAKPAPTKPTLADIAAPSNTFKHDCGCPALQCNCGAGGCHCSENRAENRLPSRWVREDGYWYLYRGTTCLGAMRVNGTQYYQWLGTDYSTVPMKPPSVPPYHEQSMVQAPPVCRT